MASFAARRSLSSTRADDNQQLVSRLREAHVVCDEHGDVATASLIEVWIDEAERRVRFLYEAGRKEPAQNSRDLNRSMKTLGNFEWSSFRRSEKPPPFRIAASSFLKRSSPNVAT